MLAVSMPCTTRAGYTSVLDFRAQYTGFGRTAQYVATAAGQQQVRVQQPHTAQPGTPPATSGHASEQAGGASPASSEGSGMPLKKRNRPSA